MGVGYLWLVRGQTSMQLTDEPSHVPGIPSHLGYDDFQIYIS